MVVVFSLFFLPSSLLASFLRPFLGGLGAGPAEVGVPAALGVAVSVLGGDGIGGDVP